VIAPNSIEQVAVSGSSSLDLNASFRISETTVSAVSVGVRVIADSSRGDATPNLTSRNITIDDSVSCDYSVVADEQSVPTLKEDDCARAYNYPITDDDSAAWRNLTPPELCIRSAKSHALVETDVVTNYRCIMNN
jgi:hypothetical protein